MSDNEITSNNSGTASNNNGGGSSDKNEYERVCYMCHRPESKVDKMIVIPNNICICSDCMQNKRRNRYVMRVVRIARHLAT